jgi:cobalt/nickel transport system ATP-binding protein
VTAAIEARGLHFHYPDGTKGVGAIDVVIERGARWGVIGPNGSGKSTLLHHFAGVHPAEGHLRVLGLEATRGNLPEIRRRVGFLFQDPDDQLFLPTVGEDVAFGPRNLGLPADEVDRRVRAALERLEIPHLADRATHHLSGGEKQSAAIAAVLALEPEILVLDEPSNDLDGGARRRLIGFLAGWERTLVVATHDLELLLDTVGEILLLDGGARVACGRAAELLRDCALLERHGLEEPASVRALRLAREGDATAR